MLCPPEIQFDTVKAVTAYVMVREHLKKLHIPYEDYEEPYEHILNYAKRTNGEIPTMKTEITSTTANECTSTTNALDTFLKFGDEYTSSSSTDNIKKTETHSSKIYKRIIPLSNTSLESAEHSVVKNEVIDLSDDGNDLFEEETLPEVTKQESVMEQVKKRSFENLEDFPSISTQSNKRPKSLSNSASGNSEKENIENETQISAVQSTSTSVNAETSNTTSNIRKVPKTNFKFKKLEKRMVLPSWLDF